MNDMNICRFVENVKQNNNIFIMHCVFEKKEQEFDSWKTLSFYKMAYVSEGEGIYHTQQRTYHLKKGDVFFCKPGMLYGIQSVQNFSYYYVGCLGERIMSLIDTCKIESKNCVFPNFLELEQLFQRIIKMPKNSLSIAAESLLLYVFSELEFRSLSQEKEVKETNKILRKYIEEKTKV